MQVLLQAPEGCGGLSFEGENYAADEKGVVKAPYEALSAAVALHFKPIGAEDEEAVENPFANPQPPIAGVKKAKANV
jgi:hypothetical protein